MGRPKKPEAELKTPRNPNVKPPPEPKAVEKKLTADSPLEDFEPMFEMLENHDLGLTHITVEFGIRRCTFLWWCRSRPDLQARLDRAKENQIDFLEEHITEIANDGRNDWMERLAYNGGNPGWEVNGENIQRSKLRWENARWRLAHLRPKKFGEKLEIKAEVSLAAAIRERRLARLAASNGSSE